MYKVICHGRLEEAGRLKKRKRRLDHRRTEAPVAAV
jgi:hypothetical protein